jgi:hypothetical protein
MARKKVAAAKFKEECLSLIGRRQGHRRLERGGAAVAATMVAVRLDP